MLSATQVSRHYWWILLVRGIVAILFGIAAFVWPGLTFLVLVFLFGVYALIDGVVAVVVALQERSMWTRWWVLLVEGIVGILIGIAAFVWPGITGLALLYLIAAWAIITGIIEIAAAFSIRNAMGSEWTLALGGLLSIILGIVLIAQPLAGILALIWVIALYAVIWGILLIVRAFQFRSSSSISSTPLG
jgi:uncharacterized membrane protein HdeD (DUF308 family)